MSLQYALLQLLGDGQFHSGEDLAKTLGVTRAAIWKQLKELQTQFQLDIHSVRGRGYRLVEAIELLDAKIIQQAWQTAYPNAKLNIMVSVDSTNQYLLQQTSDDLSSPAIVLAEYQTAGRGRRGKTWVSPFGNNIYLSMRYQFKQNVGQLMGLSLAVGVAVSRVLTKLGIHDIQLKWPNDVLYQGKKLCGILLEMQGESHGPQTVIAGVGLNIKLPNSVADSIDQPWIALDSIVSGMTLSRNELASQLIKEMLDSFVSFEQQGLTPFRQAWQQQDKVINKKVNLLLGERIVQGIARGVDEQGALLVETESGIQRFYSGEVSVRLES